MKASSKAYELIRKFEGKSNTAYQDSVGVWTIGYGHTGDVVKGQTITDAEVERLLAADVAVAEKVVNAQNLTLTQNQFDALVDFVFNLGAGNFQKSTLLKKINPPNDRLLRRVLRWGMQAALNCSAVAAELTSRLYFRYPKKSLHNIYCTAITSITFLFVSKINYIYKLIFEIGAHKGVRHSHLLQVSVSSYR